MSRLAKALELQLQHQSFQWIFRTDFLRKDWLDLLAVQGGAATMEKQHGSPSKILKIKLPYDSLILLLSI